MAGKFDIQKIINDVKSIIEGCDPCNRDEGGQLRVGANVGVRTKDNHNEVLLNLNGDRNYVQYQSVLHAIKMLVTIDKDMFF